MSPPVVLAKTQAARQLVGGPRSALAVPLRMLLINVDGQRSLAELHDIARSLNLGPQALDELHQAGLITAAPAAPQAVAAVAPPPAPQAAPAPPGDELRRLMRAKMFAIDLACRMLAGRDGELRASAREVDSESRFLDWLAEAAARIEAASDSERAQLFRERVAQAAV